MSSRKVLESLYSLRRRRTLLPQANGYARQKKFQIGKSVHTPKPSLVQCRRRSLLPRASIAASVVPISRSPLLMRKDLFCMNGSNNGIRGHYDVAATETYEFDDDSNEHSSSTHGGHESLFQSSPVSQVDLDSDSSNLVVVLDMDECIIHSQFLTMASDLDNYRQYEADRPASQAFKYDEEPQSIIPSSCESFRLCLPDGDQVHVNKRPKLDAFLKEITSRYQTYIFTAAMEVYAAPLLDRLDPDHSMFSGRFYREHCTFDPSLGVYVKDLNNIKLHKSKEKDDNEAIHLFNDKRVVLVDNNPYSFIANPQNGILVSNFYDDPKDDTLQAVVELLEELDSVDDVRPVLDEKFGLEQALKEIARSPGDWK